MCGGRVCHCALANHACGTHWRGRRAGLGALLDAWGASERLVLKRTFLPGSLNACDPWHAFWEHKRCGKTTVKRAMRKRKNCWFETSLCGQADSSRSQWTSMSPLPATSTSSVRSKRRPRPWGRGARISRAVTPDTCTGRERSGRRDGASAAHGSSVAQPDLVAQPDIARFPHQDASGQGRLLHGTRDAHGVAEEGHACRTAQARRGHRDGAPMDAHANVRGAEVVGTEAELRGGSGGERGQSEAVVRGLKTNSR